jgi:hypothetical protein
MFILSWLLLTDYGADSFWRTHQPLSGSRNSLVCMEPRVPLSCLQDPTTELYSEAVCSSTHLHTLFILRSVLILSSRIRLGLPSGLVSSRVFDCNFIFISHMLSASRSYWDIIFTLDFTKLCSYGARIRFETFTINENRASQLLNSCKIWIGDDTTRFMLGLCSRPFEIKKNLTWNG